MNTSMLRLGMAILLGIVFLSGCGTTPETKPDEPAAEATAAVEPAAPAAEIAPAPQAEPVSMEVSPSAPAAEKRPAKPAKPKLKKAAVPLPVVQTPAPVAVPAVASEQDIANALAMVDESVKRFVREQAQFNAPNSMKRDAKAVATLSFLKPGSLDELRSALAANEQIRKAKVQVSSRMDARLVSEGINVKAGGPETQEVSATVPGQWKWDLEPIAEGPQKLHLSLGVQTTIDGITSPRVVHTFDKAILVEGAVPATSGGIFSAYGLWSVLGLVVAGVLLVWKKRAA